jgi:hypothetical protein
MIPAARKRDTGATAALTQYDRRSYWIPGSYAPSLSKKHHSFLRLLKNKGFQKESMTKVGLDAIGTSMTLESNKSLTPIASSLPSALPRSIPKVRE